MCWRPPRQEVPPYPSYLPGDLNPNKTPLRHQSFPLPPPLWQRALLPSFASKAPTKRNEQCPAAEMPKLDDISIPPVK